MTDWLTPRVTTLAFCWRLARRDGVVLGFTSHDRDLIIDGLVYRAAPGMRPSAIALASDFAPDSVELAGALTHGALTDTDLAAGRWDGAQLQLFAADWQQPASARLPFIEGSLGDITLSDSGFEVELRGAATILDAAVVENCSPHCRASLGDARCRVDMSARELIVEVEAADDTELTLDRVLKTHDFAHGTLRWIDGANAAIDQPILANHENRLTLAQAPPFAVTPGTRVRLREGCDRQFESCTQRFANGVNFRGEPHLPGNDVLIRYGN